MRKIKKLIPQEIKNLYHLFIAFFSVIYFGYPARKLTVIGVTGTDGKTTTSTLIYNILRAGGKKVALVTSVAAYIGKDEIETGLHVTSPDPWDLQKLLRKIVNSGFEYVVLESTSHGLDQHRLFGVNFKVGVLTNITREHLDYHKTYKNYVTAKARLFKNARVAVLNKEDKSYKLVRKYIPEGVRILEYTNDTLHGEIRRSTETRFAENYNRLNTAAAVLTAQELGVDTKGIIKGIEEFRGIPGRLEEVKNKKGIRIIVDFAHTINGLESVLTALRKQKQKGKKLIAVFGCASERDDAKRAPMAEASTRLADISVFTAEDPRYEDIEKIISEMEEGVKNKKAKYYKIPERGEAIHFAINRLAKKGDTVVICGKGHEKSMAYHGIEYPWSDFKAIDKALDGKVLEIKR